jgi:hypothetical protein
VIAGAKIRKLSLIIGYLFPGLILQIVIVKMQAIGQSLEGVPSVHINFFVVRK